MEPFVDWPPPPQSHWIAPTQKAHNFKKEQKCGRLGLGLGLGGAKLWFRGQTSDPRVLPQKGVRPIRDGKMTNRGGYRNKANSEGMLRQEGGGAGGSVTYCAEMRGVELECQKRKRVQMAKMRQCTARSEEGASVIRRWGGGRRRDTSLDPRGS